MINVEDLTFSYPGSREKTIKGMNFHIEKGEVFGFLGPSGAGKSTIQKILIGLLKGYQGSVSVNGREIKELKSEGKTIIITTHNMTVAEEICHRVAFVVDGQISLIDSPKHLMIERGKRTVKVEYKTAAHTAEDEFELKNLKENP